MEAVSPSTISKRARHQSATYSLAEFAALLGVSYTTLHEMAQRGATPVPALRIGRQYLFPRASVDRLLDRDDAYVPDDAA